MHGLDIIRDRNARAVVREFLDAVLDGNDELADRIVNANPDLAAEFYVALATMEGTNAENH